MSKTLHQIKNSIVAVKSKFDADIVRFSVNQDDSKSCDDFKKFLAEKHNISSDFKFDIWYTDPTDGDLLPINNDNNLARALIAAKPLLRILIQRQGEGPQGIKSKTLTSSIFGAQGKPRSFGISCPQNFRQVSAIIDVDILPESYRRVKLLKYGLDKPLGFYIKEGPSYRVVQNGDIEKVPGVFISRIVPGGLAECTGLLGVNDEVLEVNGIEVLGKTLDQVTDMMIANSANLIITVKPANRQSNATIPPRDSFSRSSQNSTESRKSIESEEMCSEEDTDDVVDLTKCKIQDDIAGIDSSRYEYISRL